MSATSKECVSATFTSRIANGAELCVHTGNRAQRNGFLINHLKNKHIAWQAPQQHQNDASAPKSRDYSSWLSRSSICSKKFDIPELATSELVAGVNDLSYHSKYVEHISNDITAMVLTQASPFHDKPAMKNQVRKTQWCA